MGAVRAACARCLPQARGPAYEDVGNRMIKHKTSRHKTARTPRDATSRPGVELPCVLFLIPVIMALLPQGQYRRPQLQIVPGRLCFAFSIASPIPSTVPCSLLAIPCFYRLLPPPLSPVS